MKKEIGVLALLIVVMSSLSCGGGGGTVQPNPNPPNNNPQPPNVAGSWIFLITITEDPSGAFGVGSTFNKAAVVSQTGSNFTVLISTGETGVGTFSGSNFTLTFNWQFDDVPGSVYAVHEVVTGTATSATFQGTGYQDYTLTNGPDAVGLDDVRVKYSFAGTKQP